MAVIAYSQTRERSELTFGELADQVGRARAGLRRLGVGRGDRVVGYRAEHPRGAGGLPGLRLAGRDLGLLRAGVRGAQRRRPGRPDRAHRPDRGRRVHLRHQGDRQDRRARGDPEPGCRPLRHVVGIELRAPRGDRRAAVVGAAARSPAPVEFDRVPFDHPLYVLFSSGTTGLPKAIVHGHGGILLEHLKTAGLPPRHPARRPVLWFTTTAWAMWNITISALLRRATIVVVDGNPLHPDLLQQWRIAAEAGVSLLGTSPAYLMSCRAAGIEPARTGDLSRTCGRWASPAHRCPARASTGRRAARRPGAGQLDQRRHGRLLRFVGGQPVAPGVPRRAVRAVPRRRRHRVRPGGQRDRRRGRRAGDPPAHAVDAGRLLERPGRRALPVFLLRRLPRASGGTATGSRCRRTAAS